MVNKKEVIACSSRPGIYEAFRRVYEAMLWWLLEFQAGSEFGKPV